jgi:4,5-dihydroxyphthalate decarboxylase
MEWRDGRLALTLALSDYDHVRDLTSRAVRVNGIEITHLDLTIEEIFFRFAKFREWDVSEMSMGKYVAGLSQGDTSLTAIPVFPSRVFRHSSIFVRRDGQVSAPADLRGKRVGVPEWAQTAAVYTRALVMHEFGIPLDEIEWVQAGVGEAGRDEKVAPKLPPGVRLVPVADKTLDEMLLRGEIDAVFTARPLPSFLAGDQRVRRLFEEFRSVEEDYYRRTRIFPIMHVIALRRDVFAAAPWVATNLMTAFEEAKRRSIARVTEATASRIPVPWGYDTAARTQAIFGPDYFPYGVEANRRTLDAFLQYAFEQGVCHRRLAVDELFPAEVRSRTKV